jgi:hypothetical protein
LKRKLAGSSRRGPDKYHTAKRIEEIKNMSRSSKYVAAAIKIAAFAAVLAPTALYALTPDLSPEQKGRPRAEKVRKR